MAILQDKDYQKSERNKDRHAPYPDLSGLAMTIDSVFHCEPMIKYETPLKNFKLTHYHRFEFLYKRGKRSHFKSMKDVGLKGVYLTRRNRRLLAKGIASLARKFSRHEDGRPDAHILQQILRFLRTNDPKEKGMLAFLFKGRRIKLAQQAKTAATAPLLKREKSSAKNKESKQPTETPPPATTTDPEKSQSKIIQEALDSYNDEISEMLKDALAAEGLSDEEILEWLRCIIGNSALKAELLEIFSIVGQDKTIFRLLGHEILQTRGNLRLQDPTNEFLKIAEEENEPGSRERRLINFLCSGGIERHVGAGKGLRLAEQVSSNEKNEEKDINKTAAANLAQWQHELIVADSSADDSSSPSSEKEDSSDTSDFNASS